MKEERYGVFINADYVIIYFEFDSEAQWDKTTGSKNKKKAYTNKDFTKNGPKNGIASYYFNQPDGSIIIIDKD